MNEVSVSGHSGLGVLCSKADRGASAVWPGHLGLSWMGLNNPKQLLVGLHVCAMDYNSRVWLIHICMPVSEWIAILESKVPKVLYSGIKMSEP